MSTETHQTVAPSRATSRAKGSSFYFAMRLLPRQQREAMFEVYSFCKVVDDIADGQAPRAWRVARLAEWRNRIEGLYSGRVPTEFEPLARTIDHFGLRIEDFLAVIEGMEMDAVEDIRAPDMARLEYYCDRVACAVGRLSVRIFGMDELDGSLLAHHLGRALQLTNILRDIDEDAAVGRLYLPREALELAGIQTTDPEQAIASPAIESACLFVADRAREHFANSDEILARSPRRTTRAPKIMSAAYQQILQELIARGWSSPRKAVHLSKSQLLRIALRHAFA
jgi:squalene synthase HpnD